MATLCQAEQQGAARRQAASKMAQLAAQAQLSQLQVRHGLAAARRQRVASLRSCIPIEAAAGGEMLAPFSDVAEADEVGERKEP